MPKRKLPFRPKASYEISQRYNDGVVQICTVTDRAAGGRLPEPEIELRLRLPYEERKLGIRRFYDARQNNIKVERVIRVPKAPPEVVLRDEDTYEAKTVSGIITSQDAAITEDDRKYRIDLVQEVMDVYPASLDLTLVAFDQTPETSLVEV